MNKVITFINEQNILAITTVSTRELAEIIRLLKTPGDEGVTIPRMFTKDNIRALTEDQLLALTGAQVEALALEEFCHRVVPEGASFNIIDKDKIPKKCYFRNAWKLNGDIVDFDIEKAKPIQMVEIRKARNEKLLELDFGIMIAERSGDTGIKSQLLEKRLVLLDVPQKCEVELESITDIEEIRSTWDDSLNTDIYL